MKDLIKQVALDIANKLDPARAELGGDFQFGFNTVQLFAELVVAELSKRAEAETEVIAAYRMTSESNVINKTLRSGTKLFTFPPIHDIEAIENRTAEACAKVYLETYDLTDIADDVRSGEWRKYK